MSIEGVEKLIEEMCGGRPPISSFGERLKEELNGVLMQDAAVEPGTEPEESEDDSPGPDAQPDAPLEKGGE